MCDRKLLSALLYSSPLNFSQHASSDVEKMILGNKCDMTDRRQVSKDRGEKVNALSQSEMPPVSVLTSVQVVMTSFCPPSWPSIME